MLESDEMLDEDYDDSKHRDADPKEDIPKAPLSDDEKKQLADALMARLSEINDPVQKDWYQALFAIAMDDHEGDIKAAIEQANEVFNDNPNPPE